MVVVVLVITLDVLPQQLQGLLVLERRLQRLVLTDKTDTQQTVPLQEVDIRQRVLRLYSHNAALHLRGRFEVVLAHLDQVIHLG
jgi:hypothetical protein